MRLTQFPGEIREAVAAWEIMRRLGFDRENLNVGIVTIRGQGRVVLQVDVQGKTATIVVGRTTMSPVLFDFLWVRLAKGIQFVPEADMQSNYVNSESFRRKEELAQALIDAELYWPKHPQFNRSVM